MFPFLRHDLSSLREEHRLNVFDKRAPKRIFWSKRYKMTGGCRKLNNGKFRNLFYSRNIISVIKCRKVG
jgi:hypothetical protein